LGPSELHLGEGGELGEAAEGEDEGAGVARFEDARGAPRVVAEGVTGEDFVAQEGEAGGGEGGELVFLEERSGGVVGGDDDDGARGRVDRGAEGGQVDVPFAVVAEGVGDDAYGFEGGEVLEEGVARLGTRMASPGSQRSLKRKA
jgi:hypothetical protein